MENRTFNLLFFGIFGTILFFASLSTSMPTKDQYSFLDKAHALRMICKETNVEGGVMMECSPVNAPGGGPGSPDPGPSRNFPGMADPPGGGPKENKGDPVCLDTNQQPMKCPQKAKKPTSTPPTRDKVNCKERQGTSVEKAVCEAACAAGSAMVGAKVCKKLIGPVGYLCIGGFTAAGELCQPPCDKRCDEKDNEFIEWQKKQRDKNCQKNIHNPLCLGR